jgi:hypothetical protein
VLFHLPIRRPLLSRSSSLPGADSLCLVRVSGHSVPNRCERLFLCERFPLSCVKIATLSRIRVVASRNPRHFSAC